GTQVRQLPGVDLETRRAPVDSRGPAQRRLVLEGPRRRLEALDLARDPDARREGLDAREANLSVPERARRESVRGELRRLEEADAGDAEDVEAIGSGLRACQLDQLNA